MGVCVGVGGCATKQDGAMDTSYKRERERRGERSRNEAAGKRRIDSLEVPAIQR